MISLIPHMLMAKYIFGRCHSEVQPKNLMFSIKMRSFTIVQDDSVRFFVNYIQINLIFFLF